MGAFFKHHNRIHRVAVVSAKDWVAHALHAFAWMVPRELKLFGLDEFEQATAWVAA